MCNKKFFDKMYNAVGKLSCAALHGPRYADENGIDIAEECSFLIAAIKKIEEICKQEETLIKLEKRAESEE